MSFTTYFFKFPHLFFLAGLNKPSPILRMFEHLLIKRNISLILEEYMSVLAVLFTVQSPQICDKSHGFSTGKISDSQSEDSTGLIIKSSTYLCIIVCSRICVKLSPSREYNFQEKKMCLMFSDHHHHSLFDVLHLVFQSQGISL